MNVLVDTCVWSLALRRSSATRTVEESAITRSLSALIEHRRARLVGPVRQELLSGIRDQQRFRSVRDSLHSFPDEPLAMEDWEFAAEANNRCRSTGIAGSLVDFLICAVAINRNWEIFTTDADFARYSRVLPLVIHQP